MHFLLLSFSFYLIEAEHGYASSLPMPIEDHGSSPTPSSSSSSTRPIKIKKNQGSRSVVFWSCLTRFSNLDTRWLIWLFFCVSHQQVDTQRVGEEQVRETRNRRQQQRLTRQQNKTPLFSSSFTSRDSMTSANRWRQRETFFLNLCVRALSYFSFLGRWYIPFDGSRGRRIAWPNSRFCLELPCFS